MKRTQYIAAGLLSISLVVPGLADADKTIGWIEDVQIPAQDITFTAKIDTGADHTSLHATNVEVYEQGNLKRVRFSVENRDGTSRQFDMPLVRITQIKRKSAEPIQRPVVNMDICVGNTLKTTPVNLANRDNFKYRMLIGRSYLKDEYLVNSGKQFTIKPSCQNADLAMND